MLVTPRFLSCYPMCYFQVHFLLVVLSIQRNIFKNKGKNREEVQVCLEVNSILKT